MLGTCCEDLKGSYLVAEVVESPEWKRLQSLYNEDQEKERLPKGQHWQKRALPLPREEDGAKRQRLDQTVPKTVANLVSTSTNSKTAIDVRVSDPCSNTRNACANNFRYRLLRITAGRQRTQHEPWTTAKKPHLKTRKPYQKKIHVQNLKKGPLPLQANPHPATILTHLPWNQAPHQSRRGSRLHQRNHHLPKFPLAQRSRSEAHR